MRRRSLVAGAALFFVAALGAFACRKSAEHPEAIVTPSITEVLARHRDELMALPDVNGVGEGAESGRPVVLVLAIRDSPGLRQRLPRTLEGYAVRVRVVGTVRADGR